jgi:acetyl-CoA carboxylase biotin carboxyl carrier protein
VGRTGGDQEPSSLTPERVADLVRSLASVMRQSDVNELELDLGTLSLRMRRQVHEAVSAGEVPHVVEERIAEGSAPLEHVIAAPMIGTFYRSPTPGAAPFVVEGDQVTVGQTIGVIEAMKIMNEIAADRSGAVVAIYAGNGQPVEYGSPLMLLDLGKGERS